MSKNTGYVVLDFKQMFWHHGIWDGNNAYHGKKGTQWFGMAAFVMNTVDAHICQENTLEDNEMEAAASDKVDILEGDEVESLEGEFEG